MSEKRKICVVTGTRAEYGLLFPLIKEIDRTPELELQVIVTGMHLSPEFGLTYKQIEEDGIVIDRKVEMLLSSDSPNGISKSISLAISGFTDAYVEIVPDMVLVLGDRFEIYGAVCAAMVHRIPIAHLHGGETSQGVIDEAIRHAVTKMSHLHFTATDEYRRRVVQLGENPNRVFQVGALGVENIKQIELLDRRTFEKSIDFKLGKKNLLITFHPVTLDNNTAHQQFSELLAACNSLKDTHLIFTKPNADTGGRIIIRMIDDYVSQHMGTCRAFTSLGQLRYLSALQFIDAVVGNSSSGLIEAPSFKIATINIGDRQQGRVTAESVIHCEPDRELINRSIESVYSESFQNKLQHVQNPYEADMTSKSIVKIIKEYPLKDILKKKFFDLDVDITC